MSEPKESLNRYKVLPYKYNKELIDTARAQIEAEWRAEDEKFQNMLRESVWQSGAIPKPRYHFYFKNCQDYIKQVLDRAASLATAKKPLYVR